MAQPTRDGGDLTEPRCDVSAGDVTGLLRSWTDGNKEALDRLMPLIFDELHRLARHHLRRLPSSPTVQPTMLVNEAYIRLVGLEVEGFDNRKQFFSLASGIVRGLLVDHLRAWQAQKRGGEALEIPLEMVRRMPNPERLDASEVLSLHDALGRLEAVDPRRGRLVELRYFGGLTLPEIAEVLDISVPTAERDWRLARRWLVSRLEASSRPST